MRPIASALLLLFAASTQPQQNAQPLATAPPPLVEKIDVSVVNVDVSVMNRRGEPVSGLTRDDFEIYEDGKAQPISNFYSVENAQPRPNPQQTATPTEEAAPPPERFRRKVLVLVDNVSATARGRNDALGKLETFIKDHFSDGRYDWSIALMDSHLHLILPMTSDKRVLHDVVSEIRRSPSRKEMKISITTADFSRTTDTTNPTGLHEGVQTTDNTRNFREETNMSEQMMFASSTTDAILQAVRGFGTSEGRKIVLLVTGRLPLAHAFPTDRIGTDVKKLGNHIQTLTSADRELSTMQQTLVREANASNTSFYIISADGLEVPEQEPVTKYFGAPPTHSNAPDTSSMFWLATETGGAYMPGNRIDQSFAEFDRRSSTFYSLGFAPQHPDDSHYHRLNVRVKGHPEYRLQYRDGYSSAPADQQMSRTLRSPLGATMQPSTMSMSLIVGEPQYRGVTALVPLQAAMTMESLQYITDARGSRTRLHIYVSIFDSEGRNLALSKSFADIALQPNESATGPMTVTIPTLSLAKGTYRVVVAVRDELTDHVGLAEKKVNV